MLVFIFSLKILIKNNKINKKINIVKYNNINE